MTTAKIRGSLELEKRHDNDDNDDNRTTESLTPAPSTKRTVVRLLCGNIFRSPKTMKFTI